MADQVQRRLWIVSPTYREAGVFVRSETGQALVRAHGIRERDRLRIAVDARGLRGLSGRYVHLVVLRPELLNRELDETLLRLQDQGATLEHRSQW